MNKHRTHRTWWDRLLSGVLCLALALGMVPAVGLVQTAAAAHWADPYGEQLVEWGVMNPGSDLRLGDVITRAEFVAMCNRAFGYKRLGGTPFTDVPSSAWYAQDIDIAYNAGYFNGGASNLAYPNDPLTREQAAVLLARNMMLQETVGESQGFTDSRDLSEWSRGLIGAAVAEGVITGYTDGSFLPLNNITRGEVAALLVRAIGTPVSTAGNHELGDVYGNVFINSSNVTLRNTFIVGNLYITGGIDLGNVLLENVTVTGRIVVSGGGASDAAKSSVVLRNVAAEELVVDSIIDQFVTVSAYGLTDIPITNVRTDAYLEDSCAAGYGLHHIELVGKPGTKLQLAGSIKEVVNKTPFSNLQLVKGTAETITIDEYATNSRLLIDINTVVNELNLDVATLVTGQGDIINLNIAADGCEVDILPEHVEIRPGLTATIGDEEIGSAAASELSSEPRLLAGYPSVTNLRPTEASALFAGNKPGTIYWAVSAIADGSVSVEHLLNNPAYGGNILKDETTGLSQSGSIDTDAKTVHGWPVTGLEPDGSYYISAILMDARGNRSPLKVVSFTTPDDTVPAFVEEPHMSKISCEVAQVTAMANKSCTLYWVLLEKGAKAPTPQNFKSGSFGGNYGSGSINVVKNVPVVVQVNTTSRLQEKHDYDLYLWLCDFDGTMSSEVKHVVNEVTGKDSDPTFTTPDETPPVILDVSQNDFKQLDSIGFTFRVNEAPVTLYWAVVAEADSTFIRPNADLNSRAVQSKVMNGLSANAYVWGYKETNGANVDVQVTAADFLRYSEGKTLSPDTYPHTHSFKMYYVAMDGDDNYSEVGSIIIHTLDNEDPEVTIEFSSAMYNTDEDKAAGRTPRPQADSDIMLIFTEQVKGEGENGQPARTFVDLYSDVARFESQGLKDGDSLLDNAKDALGKALSNCITMINVQGRDETDMKEPKKVNGQLAATQETYGWIDLRQATVKLLDDGRVMLTLPAGKAVQMGGGMEYYFRFNNIFDDSYTGNPLKLTRRSDGRTDGGTNASGIKDTECYTDTFTTVYAQVWLYEDDTGLAGSDATVNNLPVTMDMVVVADPRSASSTAGSDYWDMVIWNDSTVSVEIVIYRSVDGGATWQPVTGKVEITGTLAISLNEHKIASYISGSDAFNGETYRHAQYETIETGLVQGQKYLYGINFTAIGGDPDDKAWSSQISLRFSLVAGTLNNVRNLQDGVVAENYPTYVDEMGYLSEIGSVSIKTATGTTTGTQLTVTKRFTDTRAPAFIEGWPKFTSTSSTISMEVYLERPGTIYFLTIPANKLVPSFDNNGTTVRLNSATDGRDIDDAIASAAAKETSIGNLNWTYIPTDGADRDNRDDKIYFMSGGDKTDTQYTGVYTTPKYDEIFVGTYAVDAANTEAGSYAYTSGTRDVSLDNNQADLLPETWYYVCLVLRSESGTFDKAVQIYRVKTKEAAPPALTVTRVTVPSSESGITGGNSTTGVSMSVLDPVSGRAYDNPLLYYALARKDDLPSYFTDWYTWSDETTSGNATKLPTAPGANAASNQMTVLSALINKPTGSRRTYFDMYADNDLKNNVMRYITDSTSDNTYGSTIHGYEPLNVNSKRQECVNEMSMDGEYVILVCARHNSDNIANDITKYGFAATQGLFRPDNVPPEFTGITDKNVRATITGASKTYGGTVETSWGTWTGREVANGFFSGQLTLTFSKAIYVYDTSDNNTLKKVVGNASANSKTEISITSVISAPAGVFWYATSTSDTSFTILFANLADGQSLIMQNLYNSTGSAEGKSPKTLTVTFDAKTTTDTFDHKDASGNNIYITYAEPSFYTTWK